MVEKHLKAEEHKTELSLEQTLPFPPSRLCQSRMWIPQMLSAQSLHRGNVQVMDGAVTAWLCHPSQDLQQTHVLPGARFP